MKTGLHIVPLHLHLDATCGMSAQTYAYSMRLASKELHVPVNGSQSTERRVAMPRAWYLIFGRVHTIRGITGSLVYPYRTPFQLN
jgi:hypothetical protein